MIFKTRGLASSRSRSTVCHAPFHMSRDVITVAHSSNAVPCALDSSSESVMTAAGTVPMLTVPWHTGLSRWCLHLKGHCGAVSDAIVSVPVRCGHPRRFMPYGYSRGWSSYMCAWHGWTAGGGHAGPASLYHSTRRWIPAMTTRFFGTDEVSSDVHTSSCLVNNTSSVGNGTTSTVVVVLWAM